MTVPVDSSFVVPPTVVLKGTPMNEHVKRFFLIFCLIGFVICAGLAIANASTKPASPEGALTFGLIGLALAVGALLFRNRREA
jgi:hypothetical protein